MNRIRIAAIVMMPLTLLCCFASGCPDDFVPPGKVVDTQTDFGSWIVVVEDASGNRHTYTEYGGRPYIGQSWPPAVTYSKSPDQLAAGEIYCDLGRDHEADWNLLARERSANHILMMTWGDGHQTARVLYGEDEIAEARAWLDKRLPLSMDPEGVEPSASALQGRRSLD